jgi:hypothetical protein
MARTIRNGKLDTRSARSRLTLRREPYWTVISEGCALGYRRRRQRRQLDQPIPRREGTTAL